MGSAELISSIILETGMERDEDGVVLGSTRLPGSQRLHRQGDATREAGSLVGPMTAADSPSAISVFRFKRFAEREDRIAFTALAQANAAFLNQSTLPRSKQMADQLAQLLGLSV